VHSIDFEHFLLTRFNVRHDQRVADDWLHHRLGYFERLCIASVTQQTNRNFRWLVYFDNERAQWFQNEVDRLAVDAFEPVWVDGRFSAEKEVAAIAERSVAPWLITTRLDNDDALARDFIDVLQNQFKKQELEFLNFRSGLQLSEEGGVYHRRESSNAFVSLIERRGSQPPIGVYVDQHNRVYRHGPLRQVAAHPMWLQMVHERNISNMVHGVRANPAILKRFFDIQAVVAPMSPVALRTQQAKTATVLLSHALLRHVHLGGGDRA
jgi:Putative rhamnosyl transferase